MLFTLRVSPHADASAASAKNGLLRRQPNRILKGPKGRSAQRCKKDTATQDVLQQYGIETLHKQHEAANRKDLVVDVYEVDFRECRVCRRYC